MIATWYALVMGFALGCLFTWAVTSDTMESDAIKAGVAEYVIVNKETGAVEFRWKESK